MSAIGALPRLAGQLALALLAVAGLVALGVWALGAGQRTRELLDFGFAAPAREAEVALDIAVTNLRLVSTCLVAAFTIRTRPEFRGVLDLVVGLLLAFNVGVLGVALGAYGDRVLVAVALHGPLELAAFSLAGGAYLVARESQVSLTALGMTTGVAVALVAAGALVEAYAQLGGGL